MSASPPDPGAPAPAVTVEVVARFGDRIIDVRHVTGGRYEIGEGPDVHLTVQLPPGVDRAGIPLVIALADQAVLGLAPGMTGELVHAEQTVQIADLVAQGRRSTALPRGATCELVLGGLRFTITLVEPAAFTAERRPLDRLYWASNALSLLLLGGLVLLGEPRPPGELTVEELTASRERAARLLSELPPPPEPEHPRPRPVTTPVLKTRSTTPPAPAPAPAPSPPPTTSLLELPAEPGALPTVAKAGRRGISNDHAEARSAGILGDEGFNNSVAEFTASAQEGLLAYKNDAADTAFWNGVAGAGPRGPRLGGLDLADTERGGGARGDRKPTSKAPVKMISMSSTGGPPPSADERAEARRVISVDFERPAVQGELHPLTVQTELRRQQLGLTSCYRKVTGTEDRAGHVMFRLKVGNTGRVTSASLEHGSKGVDGIGPCLLDAARTWKFTAPLDGKPAEIVVEAALSSRSM